MKGIRQYISSVLSVKARLVIVFCCFIVFSLGHYLIISSLYHRLEVRQLQADLATSNETRLVQIQQHIREIVYNEASIKRQLVAEVAAYKASLLILQKGGEKVINETSVAIPACGADIQPLLETSEKSWQVYEAKIQGVLYEPVFKHRRVTAIPPDSMATASSASYVKTLNPSLQSLLKEINQPFDDTFTAQSEVTSALKMAISAQKTSFVTILFGLLVAQLITLTGILYYIWLFVLQPFHTLHKAASSLKSGNLNAALNTTLPHEFGNIASAMQKLLDLLEQAAMYVRLITRSVQDAAHFKTGADTENTALFTALHEMQQHFLKVSQEEDKRNWSIQRMAQFADVLRHNTSDLSETCYQALYHLVKSVNAAQGGIFLLSGEEEAESYLELKACYAFDKKKYKEARIAIGQGLVGQVYLEKSTVYLTQVPQDYIQITSGLGDDNPRNILIVPLKSADTVYGVIELASFKPFEPYVITFIEKVCENIASSVGALRVNEHTKKLLEESQLITHQLKEQEEEMRQNVEELQATQEDMKRNQALLAGQSVAINTTLLTVEYDMDGLILQVNNIFLQTMNYAAHDIKGRHHQILVAGDEAQGNEYTGFWQDLKDGKIQQGEYKRITSEGQDIWLKATYTPVKNQHGEFYKVIELAFDITVEKKTSLDLAGKMKAISRSTATAELSLYRTILETNEIFANLIGYKKAQLPGIPYDSLFSVPVKNDPAYTYLWQQVMVGNFRQHTCQLITASGKELWAEIKYNPIIDLSGQVCRIVLFIADITASKQAETENERLLLQTRKNEEELRENLLEMERKEAEIQRLLTEMKLNEEELQRAEEQLRKNIEKMQASQQKLKEKTLELEQIREEENHKVQELIITHQKEIIAMTHEVNRYAKEIKELKQEVSILKNESLS